MKGVLWVAYSVTWGFPVTFSARIPLCVHVAGRCFLGRELVPRARGHLDLPSRGLGHANVRMWGHRVPAGFPTIVTSEVITLHP